MCICVYMCKYIFLEVECRIIEVYLRSSVRILSVPREAIENTLHSREPALPFLNFTLIKRIIYSERTTLREAETLSELVLIFLLRFSPFILLFSFFYYLLLLSFSLRHISKSYAFCYRCSEMCEFEMR